MEKAKKPKLLEVIDKPIFFISLFILLIFILAYIVFPEQSATFFAATFDLFINGAPWIYVISVSIFVVFALFVALSKFGKIKLGKDDDKPQFSTFSWIAMLFACGMGIGLIFWSVSEPILHYAAAPFTESGTALAAEQALRQTIFHWGIHPWAIYVVIGLALAYFGFRKGLPPLLSSTLHPFMGDKGVYGPLGQAIDIVSLVCTSFGLAVSLGLGSMQVATGLSNVFNIPINMVTFTLIILFNSAAYITSSVTGIERGIKWLSDINMFMAIGLMAFVLVFGPTSYMLNSFSQSIGDYLQNFVWMSFFVDSNGTTAAQTYEGWIGAWTIFYWAWWLSWAPFVGTFIARISRGRTIREFIFGVMIVPTLFACIWFAIFGGAAIHMDLYQGIPIADAVAADSTNGIFALLGNLPLTTVTSLFTVAIILIFFIAGADSGTYVMAMMATKGNINPPASLKIIWGGLTGAIALILLYAGGLGAIQQIAIAIACPFIIVMLVAIVSLLKCLFQEGKADVASYDEAKEESAAPTEG